MERESENRHKNTKKRFSERVTRFLRRQPKSQPTPVANEQPTTYLPENAPDPLEAYYAARLGGKAVTAALSGDAQHSVIKESSPAPSESTPIHMQPDDRLRLADSYDDSRQHMANVSRHTMPPDARQIVRNYR